MFFGKKYQHLSLFCSIYNWFKYPRIIYSNKTEQRSNFRAVRNPVNLDGSYDYKIQEGIWEYDFENELSWVFCDDECRFLRIDSERVPFVHVEFVLGQLEHWCKISQ